MSPLLLAAGSISLLNDAKPRVILSTKTLCGILYEVRPQLAYRPAVTWVLIDGEVPEYSSYASLCAAASVTEPTNKVEAGDLITIMYTSGTDGNERNHRYWARDRDPLMPNFILLDASRPEVATIVTAMLQARAAAGRGSWQHPQEPTGDDLGRRASRSSPAQNAPFPVHCRPKAYSLPVTPSPANPSVCAACRRVGVRLCSPQNFSWSRRQQTSLASRSPQICCLLPTGD